MNVIFSSAHNKPFLSDQTMLSYLLLSQKPRQHTLTPERERYVHEHFPDQELGASMNPMKLTRLIAIICTVALSASSYSQSQSSTQRANQNSPSVRGCVSGTLAWGSNNYDDVPGIQWAFIKSYCNNGKEITIWTDFTTSMLGSNAMARAHGREIIANDGSQHSDSNSNHVISGFIEANVKVEYNFSVDPGGSEYGYINGKRYDLEEGTLFLIASSGIEIEVKQVNYNLLEVRAADITHLATNLPDIIEFYGRYHDSRI